MALKRYNRRSLLAKIETTAGTAETLAAADAILCGDVSVTPLTGDTVDRDIIRSYFGNQQQFNVRQHAQISATVELAGSGEAGTAPQFGPLLVACGMAETADKTKKTVTYTPVSAGEKTLTLLANIDGVAQTVKGARGTFSLNLAVDQIPTLQFTWIGHYADPADAQPVTADYDGWQPPVPASRVNTPTFELMGKSDLSLSELSLDYGAETSFEDPLGGSPEALITDRNSSGNLTLLAPSITDFSPVKQAAAGALGALKVVHGTTAGNVVTIEMPRVSLSSPTYGEQRGVWRVSAALRPQPVSGNDELKIVFT